MDHDHSHAHESRHSHTGGHSHGHSHAPANFDRAFAIGIGLNVAFVAAEVVFGLSSHSLALLADAGHNASDVLGLLLAWGAAWATRRLPSRNFTYGWRRSSIMASLINAVALLVAVGVIVAESIGRFANPQPIATTTVMLVAGAGIVVNGVTALLFVSGHKSDLNVRGAFLHMLSDAIVSAGVVLAALAIAFTGWLWLDPVVSLVVAAVIIVGTWGLLRESLRLSLDAVPAGIDCEKVEQYFATLPGVVAVHDMHIWSMSTTEVALTVHLGVPGPGPHDALLHRIAHDLSHDHGIAHPTVQIEEEHAACALQPADRV